MFDEERRAAQTKKTDLDPEQLSHEYSKRKDAPGSVICVVCCKAAAKCRRLSGLKGEMYDTCAGRKWKVRKKSYLYAIGDAGCARASTSKQYANVIGLEASGVLYIISIFNVAHNGYDYDREICSREDTRGSEDMLDTLVPAQMETIFSNDTL